MKINKKNMQIFCIVLLKLVIPLFLFSAGLIGYDLFMGAFEGTLRQVMVSLGMVFLLLFTYLTFLGITKYKTECLITDTERKGKWATFSPEFRRYWKYSEWFSIVFFIFLILFGVIEVFMYRNHSGAGSLTFGIGFLIMTLWRWIKNEKTTG